jgi:hypothetical protein
VTTRRWDTDERGRGIASGEAFAGNLRDLADLMADPGWVAEDPEAHLLPHVQAACDVPGSDLRLDRAWSDREILIVELTSMTPDPSIGHLRRAALTIVAAFAEGSTHVRQRRAGEVLEFEIATGTAPNDGSFAPHGHLVRLRIHRIVDGENPRRLG